MDFNQEDQIINEIRECEINGRDMLIEEAIKSKKLHSPDKIILAIRYCEHPSRACEITYKTGKLNVMQTMFLICMEENIESEIAKDFVKKEEWKKLPLNEALVALKISQNHPTIAKAVTKKSVGIK